MKFTLIVTALLCSAVAWSEVLPKDANHYLIKNALSYIQENIENDISLEVKIKDNDQFDEWPEVVISGNTASLLKFWHSCISLCLSKKEVIFC